MDTTTTLTLGPQWVFYVALFIPVITAAITRFRASTSRVQAIVAIALSALLAVIGALTDDIPQDTIASVAQVFFLAFIPALASYIGFWQPVTRINERLAPTKGL